MKGVWIFGGNSVVFVSVACRSWSFMFRGVREDVFYVGVNYVGVVGVGRCVGWCGYWGPVGVVLEELWYFILDLLFWCKLWWSLEKFDGL